MRILIVALPFLVSCSNFTHQDEHKCEVTCTKCESVKLTCERGEGKQIKVNEESDDELN
jgi:hypothetical protein